MNTAHSPTCDIISILVKILYFKVYSFIYKLIEHYNSIIIMLGEMGSLSAFATTVVYMYRVCTNDSTL